MYGELNYRVYGELYNDFRFVILHYDSLLSHPTAVNQFRMGGSGRFCSGILMSLIKEALCAPLFCLKKPPKVGGKNVVD